MQVRAVSAAAAVVLVGLSSAACNPKSKAAPTATVLPATETQAEGSASPSTSASQSASSSASVVSASPVTTSSSPAATPAAAAGGAGLDVCSLLTPAQASSINGVTYGSATSEHLVSGIADCDYKNDGSANPIDIQDLTTQVISLPGCYAQLEEADGPGVKVPGVGDDAFGYEVGIEVKVGNRCIQISGLTEAELQDNYAPDAAMAKIMISKLSS
jgi:hypothetical protein